MSKITNEQIFELLTGVQETVAEMKEDIVEMKEDIVEIKEDQIGIKETQEKLILAAVDNGVRLKTIEDNYVKIAETVQHIEEIVEVDAQKQQNHEIEHASNIVAHDRFEARIGVLEKK